MLHLFHSNILKKTLVVLGVLHMVAIFGYSLPNRLLRTDDNRDLVAYYLAIERMHNNEPLYINIPKKEPHKPDLPVYHYPPILSSIFAMLPSMSFITFARGWTLLLYLAFWVYALCLAKIFTGRMSFKSVLVAGLALSLFPGTHVALSLGQIDPLLWALFGIALVIPTLRGSGLMTIALIKPWAIWPLIWSVKGGFKIITSALIVAIGGGILGLLVRGGELFFSECLIWFRDILPSLGQGSWSSGNWSISFGALRVISFLGLWDYAGGPIPIGARLWLLFCGIAVPMLAGFFLRRKCTILQLSTIGCVAVICSPICWSSYLPVLLTLAASFVGGKLREQEN